MAAFDLGNNCGVAILPPDGEIEFLTLDLQPNRWDSGAMRYIRFEQELTRLHAKYVFELVIFEEVRRHMSTDSAHAYGAYKAFLMAWCEKNGVASTSVPVGTWKKALTNIGNADKPLVKETIRRLGFDVKTYDAADACGILLWAEKEFGSA